VVAIEARGVQVATGFVVDHDRIVTVAHAVEDGHVLVRAGDGPARPARVLRSDPELDLALLARGGSGGDDAPHTLGGTRVLVRRDGATASEPVDVVRAIDARVRTAATGEVAHRPALELAGSIRAGYSGAPVIDASGEIAGVVFARSSEREGVAYAVDAAALSSFLRAAGTRRR
jgi:S1-C subfamily serine protease